MIGELLSALVFTDTLQDIFPFDGAALEAAVGIAVAAPGPAFAEGYATLPRAQDRDLAPKKIDVGSFGIVTTAESAVVLDTRSGATLFAKQPNQVRAIGSLTKLMSALVFLETEPDLAQQVVIVADDYVGGGRLYLRFDDRVSLRDVLRVSLIGSDNTATNAFARLAGVTKDEFVSRMNAKARDLDMTRTMFTDLTGVGNDNFSTAADLTKLLAAVERQPLLMEIVDRPSTIITQGSGYTVTVESTNQLLGSYLNSGVYDIRVGKTGFIPEAGYCFAMTVAKDNHPIRVVVLGSDSLLDRFSDAKGLSAWAFKTFSWTE